MGKHSYESEPFGSHTEEEQLFERVELDMSVDMFAEVIRQIDRLYGETSKNNLLFSLPGGDFKRFVLLHRFTVHPPGQAPVEMTRLTVNNYRYDERFEDTAIEIDDYIISNDDEGLIHKKTFMRRDAKDPSKWQATRKTGPWITKKPGLASVRKNDVYEADFLSSPFFTRGIDEMEELLGLVRPVTEAWQDDVEIELV